MRRDVRVWLKEHDWKSCIRGTVSGVRIPFSPLMTAGPIGLAVFLCPFSGTLPAIEKELCDTSLSSSVSVLIINVSHRPTPLICKKSLTRRWSFPTFSFSSKPKLDLGKRQTVIELCGALLSSTTLHFIARTDTRRCLFLKSTGRNDNFI